MNLKILIILLMYYSILTGMFLVADSPMTDFGFTSTVNLNSSDITEDEQATGIFDVLPDFFRFIAFVGFGIGLPSEVPVIFATIFALWQSMLTVFTIGFIISSIWDG